jgi:hypothetical protein
MPNVSPCKILWRSHDRSKELSPRGTTKVGNHGDWRISGEGGCQARRNVGMDGQRNCKLSSLTSLLRCRRRRLGVAVRLSLWAPRNRHKIFGRSGHDGASSSRSIFQPLLRRGVLVEKVGDLVCPAIVPPSALLLPDNGAAKNRRKVLVVDGLQEVAGV